MKSSNGFFNGFCAASLAVAFLPASSSWARADTLFVQASKLNIRTEPNATARLVGSAAIASPCTMVSAATGGFAKVKCGAVEGYAKQELLASKAPEVAALVMLAQDKSKTAAERLPQAERAFALAAKNRQLYLDTFLEVMLDKAAVSAKKAGDWQSAPFDAVLHCNHHNSLPECVFATLLHSGRSTDHLPQVALRPVDPANDLDQYFADVELVSEDLVVVRGGVLEQKSEDKIEMRVRSLVAEAYIPDELLIRAALGDDPERRKALPKTFGTSLAKDERALLAPYLGFWAESDKGECHAPKRVYGDRTRLRLEIVAGHARLSIGYPSGKGAAFFVSGAEKKKDTLVLTLEGKQKAQLTVSTVSYENSDVRVVAFQPLEGLSWPKLSRLVSFVDSCSEGFATEGD